MVGVIADAVAYCDVFVGVAVPTAARGLVTRRPGRGSAIISVRIEQFETGPAAVGFAMPLTTIEIGDLIRWVTATVLEDERLIMESNMTTATLMAELASR